MLIQRKNSVPFYSHQSKKDTTTNCAHTKWPKYRREKKWRAKYIKKIIINAVSISTALHHTRSISIY